MKTIIDAILVAACGSWIGAILFHSAVVAPATFTRLSPDDAGRFLRTLFPKFFVFGLICGALMLLALVLQTLTDASPSASVVALAAAMVLMQGISLGMVPAINRARDEGESGRRRFGRLHGINVLLTLIVLFAGLLVLYLTA
jgi:hypothetical protein